MKSVGTQPNEKPQISSYSGQNEVYTGLSHTCILSGNTALVSEMSNSKTISQVGGIAQSSYMIILHVCCFHVFLHINMVIDQFYDYFELLIQHMQCKQVTGTFK